MFKRTTQLFIIFIIIFATVIGAKASENGCALSLMPCPYDISVAQGRFTFNQNVDVYFKGMSQRRKQFSIARFNKAIKGVSRIEFNGLNEVRTKDDANITILVTPNISSQQHFPPIYQIPSLADDESYQLTINKGKISILASSDFGAMHALTTLVQIITNEGIQGENKNDKKKILKLPLVNVIDKPRFKWRGLLIDSVRHFIPLEDIKRQLDGLAAAKLNVFHWHLTDDQGWRIESKRYPKLHKMASDKLFYTQEEVKDLVEYASLLGIRIIPEFDIPGHASAIAVAYPELITTKKSYQMERQWGVFEPLLDISDPAVYQFIDDIIGELTHLFPDNYIHIGGDEVHPEQWLTSERIKQLMQKHNLENVNDLQRYFNSKVQKILAKYQRKMMGWDEIYHQDLPKDIVVQSWRGSESLNEIANQGYQGLLSTGFYIDQPQYTAYHYRNDPIANLATENNGNSSERNLAVSLKENELVQSWLLTIPRLKGAEVKGEFTLIASMDSGKYQNLAGYIKLNNNNYRKVVMRSSVGSLNATALNDQTLVFELDSWMGPLRFEISMADNLNDVERSSTDKSDLLKGDTLENRKNRVVIGNAFYPLIVANKISGVLPKIQLSPQLAFVNKKNILGGEATLWSELVTKENIDLRTWPRLFAIAERLWSSQVINDTDDMYRRLAIMGHYAEKIVGLKHKVQQHTGLKGLIKTSDSANIFPALKGFAEIFEPAHYYTRHHIKYQQKQYHQQAALNGFVDYLPVESFELIELKNLVKEYQLGEPLALVKIGKMLSKWHEDALQLGTHKQLNAQFAPLLKDFKTFHQIANDIIAKCIDKKRLSGTQLVKNHQQLQQLYDQQKEVVLAIISIFQQLLTSCQFQNQQTNI